MAVFSGETTTVTTPDGRTLVLPKEVAASLQGLAPAPPPPQAIAPAGPAGGPALPAPEAPGPPPAGPPELPRGGTPMWTPADTAALAAGTPPPDATTGPVTSPAQVAKPGPARVPQGPVTDPGQDAGASSYQAPKLTNAELAKQGPAGTLEEQSSALAGEKQAINESAQVEADKATKAGAILAARDAQTQQILEQRQRQEAENRAALDARMTARDAYAAKLANTRIDRSIDHPVWAAIGLALGTLGGAMTQRQTGGAFHNAAFDALMQGIDRKVDAQMKDLENQRAALGQMNTAIGEQRQYGMDRLSEIDARKDAALQQAKQTVETMATQMKSPEALANAHLLNAKLDEERGKLRGEAADRAQAQLNVEAARKQAAAEAAANRAVTIRGQNLQLQMERERVKAQQEDKMAEISARLLAEGKKDAAAKADKAAQTVLYDPRSGDVLLNPDGQKKFAVADRMEVEARQRKDPQEAEALRKRATDLRDSARLNDGVHALEPKVAEKLRPQLQVAQNLTNEIGDVQKMLESDPSTFNREQWAGIATKLGNIANAYQKVIGERISVRAFDQTMKHILEFDPDSLFDRTASQNRALESLKQLRGIVATDIGSTLKSEGIKTDWKPVARGEDAASLDVKDKTALEAGQAEDPNWLQRIGGRIVSPTGGYDSFGFQERATADALAQPGAEGGLSPTATAAVKGLALRADRVGDAERAKIVDSIAGLASGPRESLANGVIAVLQTASPQLHDEVLAKLPKERADEIRRAEAMRAKVGAPPDVPYKASGFDPDAAAAATRRGEMAAAAKKRTGQQDEYLNVSEPAKRYHDIGRDIDRARGTP
jgi:hypothetical protein